MDKTKLVGGDELQKLLRELGKKAAPKVNRRAVNLATSIIVSAAKANAPVDTGALKKAITKKVYNRGQSANGIVGADASVIGEDGRRPAHYDHLVEYGHVDASGKTIPAKPFLRPAYDSSIGAAQSKYESELAKGIEAEAQKLAK